MVTVLLCMCLCVCAQVCLTLCDSMVCSPPGSPVHGVFRHEYWSVLLFPSIGDLPDPGTAPTSVMSVALADEFFTTESPGKLLYLFW